MADLFACEEKIVRRNKNKSSRDIYAMINLRDVNEIVPEERPATAD